LGADPLSPGRVFGFVWAFSLGLADLKLSRIQQEWTFMSWSVLLIGVSCFLLGLYLVYVMNLATPTVAISRIRVTLRKDAIVNENMLFRLVVGLFLAYIISFGLTVLIRGQVPWFADNPSKTRVGYGVFGIGLLIHSAPAVMFFVVEYFLLVPSRRRKKLLLALIFVLTGGTFLLLLYRFVLVLAAILSVVLLFYMSRVIRWRTVLLLLSTFVGLFAWMQTIRLVGQIQNFFYYLSKMTYGVKYAVFTEPYMYIVMGLENASRGIDKLEAHTLGYFTLNPLLAITGIKHWAAGYFSIDETPFLVSGYNTYPFYWYYYYDFGIPGVVLGSFLLGTFIAAIYWRMRKRPDIVTVSLYGVGVFIMVMSFYLNPLTLLNFIYVVLVIYFGQRFVGWVSSRNLEPN
jgi:oligosaccharide repeat unit polymerase